MKKILLILVLAVGAALAYLLLWPAGVEAVAWQPPQNPGHTGVFQSNHLLASVERIPVGPGPEDLTADRQGRLYTGLTDGRVVRFTPGGGAETLAETGGRPIGVAVAETGVLYIADADQGLLALDPDGRLRTLSTEFGGIRYKLADGVDVAPDGKVYFTDASSKHDLHAVTQDVVEHGGHGRLLEYDPATGETRLLLEGLNFANGVAVGPEGRYVLVNETGSYRVLRYWLRGEQAGTSDVFVDNLPGFPDNIGFNGRDRFWLAMFAPRDAIVDALGPYPMLRAALLRLPEALKPKPTRYAHVVALDLDGGVVASLQDSGPDSYAPVTDAEELGGWLYLGSLEREGVARLPLAR